jgi:hypothetical protein
VTAGKSGSAKIEGHIKFELFFDLHPYLTTELQEKHKNMFCRLFAVIVHAGKNSHSGHYLAYVRNIAMNEWWKMDDARVTAASESEVLQAEAYILFYRIVQHPVSVRLEQLYQKNQDRKRQNQKQEGEDQPITDPMVVSENVSIQDMKREEPSRKVSRKRLLTIDAGIEWARSKTNIPIHLIRKIQDLASEEITWTPEFVKKITSSGKDVPKRASGESQTATPCSFAPLRAFLCFPSVFLNPQTRMLSAVPRSSDQR